MNMPVVDMNDEFVEMKDRLTLNYDTDIYRVTGLWVVNSKKESLIAQRSFLKKHEPGLWGPSVAGTVEEGEDYDTNIYKEAQEEIGLTGVEFKKHDKMFVDDGHKYFTQWYSVCTEKSIEEFTLQKDEVEHIMWKPFADLVDEVRTYPERFVPSMKQCLSVLEEAFV